MSNASKSHVSSVQGGNGQNPTMEQIIAQLANDGLTFVPPEHRRNEYNLDQSKAEHAHAKSNVENAFRTLVAYVGLKRAGEVNVDEGINFLVRNLAHHIQLDGEKLSHDIAHTLKSLDTEGFRNNTFECEAQTREVMADIIGRVKGAYNKLCGPAKATEQSK